MEISKNNKVYQNISNMSKEKISRNEEIYTDWKEKGLNTYQLGEKYGLRQPAVHKILKRLQKRKEESENK